MCTTHDVHRQSVSNTCSHRQSITQTSAFCWVVRYIPACNSFKVTIKLSWRQGAGTFVGKLTCTECGCSWAGALYLISCTVLVYVACFLFSWQKGILCIGIAHRTLNQNLLRKTACLIRCWEHGFNHLAIQFKHRLLIPSKILRKKMFQKPCVVDICHLVTPKVSIMKPYQVCRFCLLQNSSQGFSLT